MDILGIIGYILDGIVLYIFNWTFFKSINRRINSFLVVLVYVFINSVDYFINLNINTIAVNIAVSIVSLLLISLMYESGFGAKIAGVFLFQTLAIVSEMLANGVIEIVRINSEDKYYVVGMFISKIILFFLIIIIQLFAKKRNSIPKGYLVCYMFIPFLSVVVLVGMYYAPIMDDGFMYITALSVAAINFLSYYLLNSLAMSIVEKKDKERVETLLTLEQHRFNQLSASFKTGSKLIHDINKHLTYLNKSLGDGDITGAKAYLANINDAFNNNYEVYSGNLAIDALLSDFKNRTGKECVVDIDVNINAHRINIPHYDIVTVLGNLLDNIIEHGSYTSNVKIEIFERKDMLVIHTVNAIKTGEASVIDKEFHNIGLNNVNDVLQKYGGVMDVKRQGNVYDCMVVIPVIAG